MTQIYRHHRYPTDFPTIAGTAHGRSSAQITDINQAGARLRGLINVQRGDQIMLEVLHQRISAQIRWVRGDTCGIRFTQTMATTIVDTVRQSPSRITGWRHVSSHMHEMR
ncbi:hypothetical protein AN189_08700 [Loktanella sp. 3ANDIMAR09]|uniref:PilZ domain-containing protein n=1 Tax=Loktanella sp. 3ANDIMAR09 TaxID=1225657 RepID=UPI0006F90F7C|nr:PilZ domain-containing protein [Loktanella sp. 3ANDIMAR09]KQI68911.1 hypothetical protein AN189_08700 [Loktanella sp. 3ANDIMAR09]